MGSGVAVGSSVGGIGEGDGVVVGLGVSVGTAATLAVGISIAASGMGVSDAICWHPAATIGYIKVQKYLLNKAGR